MYGKGQGDVSLIEFLDGCRDSVLLAPGTINHKWRDSSGETDQTSSLHIIGATSHL